MDPLGVLWIADIPGTSYFKTYGINLCHQFAIIAGVSVLCHAGVDSAGVESVV
jgi:hypothetical protein